MSMISDMTSEDYLIECPEKFEFPFTPYEIQVEFMKALYQTINDKKFGIFESPTGTGKSLSIICGAIRWLKDYNINQKESLTKLIDQYNLARKRLSEDSSDWLSLQSKEIEINVKLNSIKLQLNSLLKYEENIKKIKDQSKDEKIDLKKFKQKTMGDEEQENYLENDEFDDETLVSEERDEEIELEDTNDENNEFEPVKIYICSRTHSQLSQFVGEIIKSPFGNDTRTVSLASRQVYCINSKVVKLNSGALINERCLDMQKGDIKETKQDHGKVIKKQRVKDCKCPYLKQENIDRLKDVSLMEIFDIEDLITAGKELRACPYYSTRKAIKHAEIILIPYNTLLHKATREANGIKLKNNVIIIDEAHNLLEALGQMHNVEVNYLEIEHSLIQLKSYKIRFSTRFSSVTLLKINQLLFVINKLKQLFVKNIKESNTEIFTSAAFSERSEIDNFNMFKLVEFVKKSKLSQKIHHYSLKYTNNEKKIEEKGVNNFLFSIQNKSEDKTTEILKNMDEKVIEPMLVNSLISVVSFLESLTNPCEDGRILLEHCSEKKNCKLKFLLLNPSTHFKTIVEEARSVIVAGGTMKPISEFRDRLFINSQVPPHRIVEYSCDHIIPSENILPIVLTRGENGESLLFNFENRMKMGKNLSQILQEACRKIPGGVIVFFPSYQYENWLWQQLKETNFGKPVFREPKDSGSVEKVLEEYAAAIRKTNSTGALMFSVVGGKLSEGLNFSDDLGRCVIVIGLPYANVKAVDLKEKMTYLNKKEGMGAGNRFYENLCFKAVNQCIGRAIRHKDDYATVLLLDERYNRNTSKNSLPRWIKKSLQICDYKIAFNLINKFFKDRSIIPK